VNLTPSQLSTYDGSNPDLPIYLAINGTIFDVSAGRRTYGPGGSYSIFAGRDATRAFVTGCFLEDTTDDMRDAELIYIPVDDIEDEVISSAERKTRAERERREARKKVHQEIQKWEDFYKDSKKYFEVGKLVGLGKHDGPPPKLCSNAMQSRLKRSRMKKATASADGKPV
jgi:predicted heme/steroid binding protein